MSDDAKRIVILGGGTAGTMLANRLVRLSRADGADAWAQVTVVDADDEHLYQPGLLFVPFSEASETDLRAELIRPRGAALSDAVEYRRARIDRVEPATRVVHLDDGTELRYDVLVIASGSRLAPELTDGMTGQGWGTTVHEFYSLPGALALRDALRGFTHGRLVVNIAEMPIKCPVAPIEFAFLADAFLSERGCRDAVTITFVTPLDGCFTKPVATRALSHLLHDKGIALETEFATGRIDGARGLLLSWDDREVPFDLLVTVPPHQGAPFVGRSPGLGDDGDWVRTDPGSLQSRCAPEIFAIGDATDVPASKAGSVAHFEAELLAPNILRVLRGEPIRADFDGHSNCFIETGHDKALLIDFNYETEPLPGRFPFAAGPLALLEESHLNHLGKLAFRWVYWNLLMPGRDLPGIPARMRMAGKRRPPADAAADH